MESRFIVDLTGTGVGVAVEMGGGGDGAGEGWVGQWGGDLSDSRVLLTLGGKALGLARLSRAGFPVPRGICVTTRAWRHVVLHNVLKKVRWAGNISLADNLSNIRQAIVDGLIPQELMIQLEDAYVRLSEGGRVPLAIRSSAISEDGRSASSAGMLASYLNVSDFSHMIRSIKLCWASQWTLEALLYQHRMLDLVDGEGGEGGGDRGREDVQNSLTQIVPQMAVVVQQMVSPHVAGVLFSQEPVTGMGDRVVICAARGLGEHVVNGEAVDTYVVAKEDKRILEFTAHGHCQQGQLNQIDERLGGDDKRQGIEQAERVVMDEILSSEMINDLVQMACAVEIAMGEPQDIEWAIANGQIWLLQARPITTSASNPASSSIDPHGPGGQGASDSSQQSLQPLFNPSVKAHHSSCADNEPAVWSSVNVGEALPGVATPLTWSIIRSFSRRGFQIAFGSLGLTVPARFGLVGSIRGRVYLNITEFMDVASAVPFLDVQTLLALGGGFCPPRVADVLQEMASRKKKRALPYLLKMPLIATRMLLSHLFTPLRASLNSRKLEQFLKQTNAQASQLNDWSSRQLTAKLEETDSIFTTTGEVMLAAASNCLASIIMVRVLLRLVVGESVSREEQRLFAGLGVKSAAPGLDLLKLAGQVSLCPELKAALLSAIGQQGRGALETLRESPAGKCFLDGPFSEFLDRHGHRAIRETELSVSRWREDPVFLLGVLSRHIRDASVEGRGMGVQDGGSSTSITSATSANSANSTNTTTQSSATCSSRLREVVQPDHGDAVVVAGWERENTALALRKRATMEVASHLPRLLRPLFYLLLGHAQSGTRRREALRSDVVQLLGVYRMLFREAGRRLSHEGYLSEPDDVFFMKAGEIAHYLHLLTGQDQKSSGRSDNAGSRIGADESIVQAGLAKEQSMDRSACSTDVLRRKIIFSLDQSLPEPPSTFIAGEKPFHHGGSLEIECVSTSNHEGKKRGSVLRGLAASPGRVVSRVRRLDSPEQWSKLATGEILLIRSVDVGWTPLFLVAGGMITEQGGPLSHGAVVAREYGLPAVVNVPGALDVLEAGMLVEVDGDKGIVTIIEQ